MYTVCEEDITGIKRRRRDLYGDGVRNFATAPGCGRLKEDLESSTWRRRFRKPTFVCIDVDMSREMRVVFCLGLRFALEALRFVSEDLAFYLQKILRFVSKDLAFCLQKILRCVFKNLAFCLRNNAFCLLQRSYVLSRPNGDALRKCILSGPYKPTTVLVQAVAATDDSLAIPEHTTVETPMNMSPENKAYFQAEKEAIHLILTGIRDEIYSTVDACQTSQEMWEAIERLQQGESLNIQDVKKNLFWEFGKFTSHDGETMESYYTRFYKLVNDIIRNNLNVATMQVNVQFLQQLQP
nr:hypothetical protein [Tanacetum cinerariifolium]